MIMMKMTMIGMTITLKRLTETITINTSAFAHKNDRTVDDSYGDYEDDLALSYLHVL